MTFFETYLENNGFKLAEGKKGDFSTMTNVSRLWESEFNVIIVGLTCNPTRPIILYPKMVSLPHNEEDCFNCLVYLFKN